MHTIRTRRKFFKGMGAVQKHGFTAYTFDDGAIVTADADTGGSPAPK